MKNIVDSRIFDLENKNIQYYCYSGQILNAINSYMYGIGIANIIIFNNSLAKIEVNLLTSPIVNDDGTTNFDSCFYYGIDQNIFKNNLNIPTITPIQGGSLLIYDADTNSLNTTAMGYGGCWQSINQRWVPARVYERIGTVGSWPISNMQNKRLIVTCYGYIS